MIVGIGMDLADVGRIRCAAEETALLARCFSDAERALFARKKEPWDTIAANFAAKEAFSKALGTGVRGFSLRDISVLRDAQGRPYLEENALFLRLKEQWGFHAAFVTLSHDRGIAAATVILERLESQDRR